MDVASILDPAADVDGADVVHAAADVVGGVTAFRAAEPGLGEVAVLGDDVAVGAALREGGGLFPLALGDHGVGGSDEGEEDGQVDEAVEEAEDDGEEEHLVVGKDVIGLVVLNKESQGKGCLLCGNLSWKWN